jgi:hypothetical protein
LRVGVGGQTLPPVPIWYDIVKFIPEFENIRYAATTSSAIITTIYTKFGTEIEQQKQQQKQQHNFSTKGAKTSVLFISFIYFFLGNSTARPFYLH